MSTHEDQTWDLSTIFAGFHAYQAAVDDLTARTQALLARADALGPPGTDPAWTQVLPALDLLGDQVHETVSWAICVAAAATEDPEARRAEARGMALNSLYLRAWATPEALLARCSEAAFATLRAEPTLASLVPTLDQARAKAPVLLPTGEQQLFDDLADDAFHAWGQRYRRVSGSLRVQLDGRELSAGQARNLLEHQSAQVRLQAMDGLDLAWGSVADDCADALTRIIGVRQSLHARLGVDPLAIPLVRQRICRDTLEALLEACRRALPLTRRYLAARARLLGQAQVDWQDLSAPVGRAELAVTYDEARHIVAEQVGAFSPDMGDFVRHALAHRWVEAEDRPGKRPGAFCTGFPLSRESRVFMTFGGGPSSVRTLAHELGHAYHNLVMADLPRAARATTSCLAETASTFAESVVRDALLARADDPDTRLALLDRELADATTFLVNIPVRFEFEQALFALREKGPLEPASLSAEMERLQRAWYGPALGRAFPLFWAEKLHFYLTYAPFYNFPYTFGYLFSGMVYSRAKAEGPAWAATYRDLLRATGSGPGEDLAMRYLGADLRTPEAWFEPVAARLEPLVVELEAAAGAP